CAYRIDAPNIDNKKIDLFIIYIKYYERSHLTLLKFMRVCNLVKTISLSSITRPGSLGVISALQ
ncbi:hypothetical protein, partial [Algoriella sp.]|uniref:hypothetical protein n=1 Tax=Algoriella sp. TaxID=1872434 RepID=UPI003FA5FB04